MIKLSIFFEEKRLEAIIYSSCKRSKFEVKFTLRDYLSKI